VSFNFSVSVSSSIQWVLHLTELTGTVNETDALCSRLSTQYHHHYHTGTLYKSSPTQSAGCLEPFITVRAAISSSGLPQSLLLEVL
jgi:hypothetical protein